MKTFNIDLKDYNTPRDICTVMADEKCKHYTYTFHYGSKIIKHGKASDKEWQTGTWGNRIYRQAGGIPGWDYGELDDTSAREMRKGMEKCFPSVSRRDVIITVYDYTSDLAGKTEEEIDHVLLNEEHELVKQHLAEHGAPPLLNVQGTRTRTKPNLDLFSFDDDEGDVE